MASMNSKETYLYQPLAQEPMDMTKEPSPRPHSHHHHSDDQACACVEDANAHAHSDCHKRRRRCLLNLAFASTALLALLALFAYVTCSGGSETFLGFIADFASDGSASGLLRRQSDGSSSGSGQGVFVKNKLYLIVIIVGLFVCLVLGIMLAGWCCRSSFENPCCCPCYLCACCGGLVCLDCITCGLCAEGAADIGFN